MSYIQAVNIIKGVSEAVNPDGIFVHGRTWDASLEFSNLDIQIYLYPFTGNVDVNNSYYETYQITMGFYFQDEPDSTNEDRQALIQRADNLTRNFLNTLNVVEGVEVSGSRVEPSYRQMSGTYTGYILSFTLGIDTNTCGGEVEPDIPALETFCEKVDDCLNIPTSDGNYMLKILNGVKSWVASSASAVWGSITGTITNQTDLVNYITTRLTGYATEAFVTSQGYITNVITALGYTPENVANKSDSYTVSSSTTYSSTKALVDGLATKQNSLGYTAENTANKSDSFTASSSTTYASTKALADGLATRSLVLLSTANASNSSSIDFEVDFSLYKRYVIEFTGVQVGTNYDDLWLRIGTGAPVAYQSGASDYTWANGAFGINSSSVATFSGGGVYSDTKGRIGFGLNNTGVYSSSGELIIYNPSNTSLHKNIAFNTSIRSITAVTVISSLKLNGIVTYRGTSAITGIRIMASTGNILSGTFKIYGVA